MLSCPAAWAPLSGMRSVTDNHNLLQVWQMLKKLNDKLGCNIKACAIEGLGNLQLEGSDGIADAIVVPQDLVGIDQSLLPGTALEVDTFRVVNHTDGFAKEANEQAVLASIPLSSNTLRFLVDVSKNVGGMRRIFEGSRA